MRDEFLLLKEKMMQQQIEFEAMPFQHTVHIPDYIPDGVSVRVILSFDDAVVNKKPREN
jgi:hypothetical protein